MTIKSVNEPSIPNRKMLIILLWGARIVFLCAILFTIYWMMCSIADNSRTEGWLPFVYTINPYNHPYISLFIGTSILVLGLVWSMDKLEKRLDE